MAKRLTDTTKWDKLWFRKLKPIDKCFWNYICDRCDFSGIWDVDFETASHYIGETLNIEHIKEIFKKQYIELNNGNRWLIRDFIVFQYGKELVIQNRMHQSIISKLEKDDLIKYVEGVEVVEQGTSFTAIRDRVTQKTRIKIFTRDEFTCQWCNKQYPEKELTIDHFIPISLGGNNQDDNLLTCCLRCNTYKNNLMPTDFVKRKHVFLNPSVMVINKLEGVYKTLEAPNNNTKRAMVKEQEQVKDKEKEKEKKGGVGGSISHPYLKDPKFLSTYKSYLDMRKQLRRPATDKAQELILKKLSAYSIDIAIKMLEQSIENSWQGVFPLKEDRQGIDRKPEPRPSFSPKGMPQSVKDIMAKMEKK